VKTLDIYLWWGRSRRKLIHNYPVIIRSNLIQSRRRTKCTEGKAFIRS